jgi:diguanylate cyclase (GGDEF)-like protein/PAS domain S-box-containing protein
VKDQSKTKQILIKKKASLDKASEYAESIINTIREPLIILDQDLRVVTASRSFYEFFKVKPEETEGQLIYNLGNDQWDIPRLRELLETILPQKTTFDNYEVEHDFATIGKRIMLLNARQIKRALGKERIILLAIEDITERKQLESLLVATEEKYRRLFETASDGIVLLEKTEGKITQTNPATEKLLGYSEKESVGNKLQDIGVLLDENDFRTTMQNLNKSGILNYRDVKVETKSGQNVDTEIYLVDRAKLVQCNIRDITEHKKAENALWGSEEKYRWLLNNMADVITVMDMNLRFTFVSSSIMRMRGYTAEEAMAQTIEQVMTPESLQIVARVLEEEMKLEASGTADPGRMRILEVEQYRKDGSTVLMENHLSFLRDETQKAVGIISLTRDITERKRTEEKLELNFEIQAAMNILLGFSLEVKPVKEFLHSALDLVLSLKWLAIESKGAIFLTNKAGETLHLQVQRGLSKELCAMCKTVPYGYCLCGRAAEARDVQFVDHVDEHHDINYEGMPPHGHYCVPILSGDSVLGVIVLYVKEGHIRSQWEEDFLKAVANSLAGTIRRRQAEEALKESENKYRLLADNLEDVIFVLDMNLRITYVSPSVKILMGYEQEDLLTLLASEMMTPTSWDLATKNISEIMELEKAGKREIPQSQILQLEMRRKDGGTVWTEVKASFVRDENQRPVGIIGVGRDISERKRADKELRESEERFKRIFDEGPFGMGLESPDRTIIAVNKVLCELLGYTEQELIGKNIADITYEEDREKSEELLGQLFANSIPVFRMEKRYIKKDGDILWAHTTISAVDGQDGNVLYGLAIIEDLTESRKAAEKIHLLAYYDSLTELPNRTFHKELIKRSIEHAQRHKEIFAIIYIGLDNFQRINDTLGHSTGDILLKAVADRLTKSLRQSDYITRSDKHETVNVVSRMGGDEFIVLAHDLNQAEDAAKTSHRLLAEMSAPYDLNGREVFLTVSIGISLYPDDGTDVEDLLKNAEKAMRHTKSEGKNNFHFYSSSMHTSVLAVLTMESDLHKALERNELVLYYQPKVDAATRMVKGMEALIRWKHPDKGLIPPMQFIPLAETSGLIIPIGEFVIRTVCRQIKTWQEAGYKQIKISVNVSGRQFDQQNLIEIVRDALRDTMISPQCLEMEVTEGTIMRNPEKAIRILTEMKTMGIGILIDDFGTGYSSLSYLKRLPLDFLKIDQSFVKSLVSDSKDQAIVRATIAMAHSLNLKTIAEGVETEEQLSFLQAHECDEIQGYLFSRPVPAEDIPAILAKGYL